MVEGGWLNRWWQSLEALVEVLWRQPESHVRVEVEVINPFDALADESGLRSCIWTSLA